MRHLGTALARLAPGLPALLCIAVWAWPPNAQAETLEGLFERANQAFFEGDFGTASATYKALVEAGVRDPDVFYNQGIAHARRGELGRAILAFERAARLAPGDDEIEAALAQAREAIGKRLADRQGEATVRTRPPLRVALLRPWSETTLAWLLLLFNAALCGSLIARMLVRSETRRLGLAVAATVSGLCAGLAAAALAVKAGVGEPGAPAIVLATDASLREGPNPSSQARASAPEGALAWVLQRDQTWVRVRLRGGGQGWMRADEVGTLEP